LASKGNPSRPPAAVRGLGRSVLIIVENQPYFTDTRVKSEAAALREAGWRVHVICPDVSPRRPGERPPLYLSRELDGVMVRSYRTDFATRGLIGYLKEYLGSLFHIARLSLRVFRSDGFAVVHLCNPPDILFLVGAFYKLLGRRVIFDHHDLFPEMILSRHKGMARRVLYRASRILEFWTFRTADAVLSTNQSYRAVAVGRGRVREEDVFVVRNGPRAGEIVPLAPEPALKKGLPYMACYAGIMGLEDGVLELMQVIRHIVGQRRRTDILFCLLGDGAARAEAAELVRAWDIQRYVDMPGMVLDRPLFCRYLSTADIMLAPELSNPHNNKSTFIKIAEYMAMEKPIVAYDLVETRLTAGDAAVYVRSGDGEAYATAIVTLMDDPARRASMGRIGSDRVKTRFQWEHQKGHLLRAYDHVLRKAQANTDAPPPNRG
jgi:glycosyltransferase involved in cell wall biosynthesis